jgi:hypothetical protein
MQSPSGGAFRLEVGESASSFVLRLAEFLTVRPAGFLRDLLGDARTAASAIHCFEKIDLFVDASGLDRGTLSAAFVRRSSTAPNERAFLDFTISERHVDQTIRRVSPAALARDVAESRPPFHRLIWSLRDLRFDPETLTPLISDCDHCGRTLLWDNAFDPASCGRCGRPLWRSAAARQTITAVDLMLCELFHPKGKVRAERRRRLAFPLNKWAEGDLLDLLHTLRRIYRTVHLPACGPSAPMVEPEVLETTSSISEFLTGSLKSAVRSGERTAVTVAAAATTAALMASPPPVASFLTSLMVNQR